ncbi:hypothetical protein BGZ60DRAFT_411727 [Tricladium varicosporioides]|nr:hypothetical protein BGZ60DRAFT_411727 [Hymenoscyphus varicosporioides]
MYFCLQGCSVWAIGESSLQVNMISTTIEIKASPEAVREVFLNFSAWKDWHNGFYKAVTTLSDSDPFSVGRKLHCSVEGMEFDVAITQNSPNIFQWQGPPVKGVAGLHTFMFEPSKVNEGGTEFTQKEEFTGTLAFLVQPWLLGKNLDLGFRGFNEDLRRKVEGS